VTDADMLRKHGWVSVRIGERQMWDHERHGLCDWLLAMAKLARHLDAALDEAVAKRGGA
jgi:hypothetical protein